MAATSLAQVVSPINQDNPLVTEWLGEQPAILSTEVARHFQRKHQHVLRDIDKIMSMCPKSFYASNFGRIETDTFLPHSGGIRKDRAYLLTRDAFSLLVMGMTGKAAIIWKLRYIEAFNALERAALENRAELAREAGYQQGRDETLALPAMQAERKKGYLVGLKEGKRLARRADRLAALEKLAGYLARGFSYREAGKMVGLSANAVQKRIARARLLGFWPENLQAREAA